MIYLGADHGGYLMKENLKKFLTGKGEKVADFGAKRLDPLDDYPDFALPVARNVAQNKNALGILVCRNGAGVNLTANKIKGARASVAWNAQVGKTAREDDQINILCLPADYINQIEAEKIVEAFLGAREKTGEKYLRRLEKVAQIEKQT